MILIPKFDYSPNCTGGKDKQPLVCGPVLNPFFDLQFNGTYIHFNGKNRWISFDPWYGKITKYVFKLIYWIFEDKIVRQSTDQWLERMVEEHDKHPELMKYASFNLKTRKNNAHLPT